MSQAIAAYPHLVKSQEDWWCEHTGKSRATFFRLKRAYEADRKTDQQ